MCICQNNEGAMNSKAVKVLNCSAFGAHLRDTQFICVRSSLGLVLSLEECASVRINEEVMNSKAFEALNCSAFGAHLRAGMIHLITWSGLPLCMPN